MKLHLPNLAYIATLTTLFLFTNGPTYAQAPAVPGPGVATSQVNINTASPEDLKKLSLSSDDVLKILVARPFKNITEILSKNVLSEASYNKLRDTLAAAAVPNPGVTTSLLDINTASPEDLKKLSLSSDDVLKILVARPFRDTTELLSKKVVSQDTYNAVRDALTIAAVPSPVVLTSSLDINSASPEELKKLPLTSDEVLKILGARPFKDTTELLSKNVVSQDTYNRVRDALTAKIRPSEEPIVAHFFMGAEYTLEEKAGQRNFAKPFPFIGLRVNTLLDTRTDKSNTASRLSTGKVRTQIDFRLVSTAIEKFEPANPSNTNLSPERSFETQGAVFWAPLIIDIDNSKRVWEMGPILKFGGQTSESGPNFFWRTMAGIRFLETGTRLNGAYFDVGYGYSGNFLQPKYRMKVEGFLPMYDLGIPLFLQTLIESDFGSKPDLVKIAFGTFFDSSKIIDLVKKLGS